MYYFLNKETNVIGLSQCPCQSEGCICLEVTQEQYNLAQEKGNNYFVYENDEIVINPNYEEEQRQKEQERKAMLNLTRGDVFRGLLQARGITRAQLRAVIETLPTEIDGEEITELVVKKELALIDFDEALDFYRGNPLIDTIGARLDITAEQLDMFFETNDYHYLLPVEPAPIEEIEENIEE